MSRVQNTAKNLMTGIVGELLTTILKFATRSVLIQVLGVKYLGINGLFSNILTMLSLAELGVGTAIVFKLYKPIAEKDYEAIRKYLNFYRSCYTTIGMVILVLGLALLPFLHLFIKDDISFFNAPLIFILYLLQSVSSYLFFAYKSALTRASQKEYVLAPIGYLLSTLSNIAQILVLFIFENFPAYVGVVVVINIITNLCYARKTDRLFPYILKKTTSVVPKKEKIEILKDCYALFIYKINNVVVNATDNIILSSFIGLAVTGLYSNYLMIFNTIKTILAKFYTAVTASIGNLHAEAQVEREYGIFRSLNLMTIWMFGVTAIGVALLSDEFISIWIGKEYIIPEGFAFLMAAQVYIVGLQKLLTSFRTTTGLFRQAKYRPVAGMVVNVVVSLALVKPWGIHGVVFGTVFSHLITYMWYDPIVIYQNIFHCSASGYFKSNLLYLAVTIGAGFACKAALLVLPSESVGWLIVRVFVCGLLACGIYWLIFCRTVEWKYLQKSGVRLLRKIWIKLAKKKR